MVQRSATNQLQGLILSTLQQVKQAAKLPLSVLGNMRYHRLRKCWLCWNKKLSLLTSIFQNTQYLAWRKWYISLNLALVPTDFVSHIPKTLIDNALAKGEKPLISFEAGKLGFVEKKWKTSDRVSTIRSTTAIPDRKAKQTDWISEQANRKINTTKFKEKKTRWLPCYTQKEQWRRMFLELLESRQNAASNETLLCLSSWFSRFEQCSIPSNVAMYINLLAKFETKWKYSYIRKTTGCLFIFHAFSIVSMWSSLSRISALLAWWCRIAGGGTQTKHWNAL